MRIFIALSLLLAGINAEIFLDEQFSDSSWESRWVQSAHSSDYGKFELRTPKFFNDEEKDKGVKTTQDARFYAMSTKFDKPMDNEGQTLVIQFQVKHEQSIDCGGGYLKIFGDDVDQKDFHSESKYSIMFGPDQCGPSQKKVHVIFNYKGENKQNKKEIRCKDDEDSHLYTLIVKPDNTYEVLIDNEKAESGNIEDDYEMLKPKKIKDPDAKKPEDWDERAKIDDPEDKKPDDWDKEEHIPDPDASKPEDWDDEMDGEWEPPQIDNPEYKGEWKPKQIDNPDYKGVWIHPEINNPDYEADDSLYKRGKLVGLGIDIWQVKSGSIFDNILVTNDVEEAQKAGELFKVQSEGEVKQRKEHEEEENKRREEEAKASEADKDEDAAEPDDAEADAESGDEDGDGHDHEEL